ncbi:hypothetical protein TPB0596_02670 [Tsukamurella pulmonis]|uniref:Uncharacterized protein n=1 Tax=Tsukamurella pulmonis TaxID=47312 RepID=A0A1H1HRI1_9ACTN|nr:hypothetical protein [Tsukamurella pulmonis]KXO94443.1 hypothetical protein AXK56_17455 [Tsukamurella pulmonis]KXP12258.1 hypothetical protein AXK57_18245 [Tsukamurella pulmonis]RDH09782.1 hypothetical protein DVB88_21425 [Tsukamurella pulmonis]SDR28081.1 hypothetical protein SAMN04489765_4512 [Tsukamurella pulmonis]SUP13479.1 Uncharacterised protein [Tsukamurella pulmonis]
MSTPFLHPAQPRLAALRQRFAATPVGRRLDEVRPTTTWKVVSSVIYSGLIAALVMGAAVLLLGVKPASPEVASVSSVAVGDCVTVAGDSVTRTGCEGDGFSFAVAEKAAAGTACSLPSYARVESAGSVLCVVPKLALGECYQVKPDKAATTDIRPVDCPSGVGSAPSNVIRVIERAAGAPLTCRGSSALNYSAPQRMSYCIAPVT